MGGGFGPRPLGVLQMSTTNLKVIEDALRDINVISEIDSASFEQGSYGLRKLNQMMDVWRYSDMDIGYFAQTDTNEVCPIPEWTELSVTAALSLVIAPKYGATISAEQAVVINESIEATRRQLINNKLTNTDMSHMPIGQGHYYGDGRNIING